MKILSVASEVAPLAKTGGLGDVCAALPRHLAALGHDVRVVLPFYSRVRDGRRRFATVFSDLAVTLHDKEVRFSVLSTTVPGSAVPMYLVRCPGLYDRPSIYTRDPDEHLRFIVLQWAALKICQQLGWSPDVVHAHDWQTALLPLILKTALAWDRLFESTKTVLTIHNVGHQGAFAAGTLADTGLSSVAHHFHQDQIKAGVWNSLLTGILYADVVTAVSPTYAREIQTDEHGVGLGSFLRNRKETVRGILNGIDEAQWSPERDAHIPYRYSRSDLSGKERNKAALLDALGLPYDPAVPVIGIVSRLAWQKGLDLCFEVLPRLLRSVPVRVVVLGRGEPRYEEFFGRLARAFPRGVAFRRGFSEPLAHLIEAGADLFLMPSRHEPCGLNQMYSQRYGTVPVVRRTGGLADTVRLWRGPGSGGTGFVFDDFDGQALWWALSYALGTWGADREQWREIQDNGMQEDFSWTTRVGEYDRMYRQLVGR